MRILGQGLDIGAQVDHYARLNNRIRRRVFAMQPWHPGRRRNVRTAMSLAPNR